MQGECCPTCFFDGRGWFCPREWECQVVAFSETSHTKRSLPALDSEFQGFGYYLSCSDPVPDKFQVSSSLGSFRGLSRGVCAASVFPAFTPRPQFIPRQAWSSQQRCPSFSVALARFYGVLVSQCGGW